MVYRCEIVDRSGVVDRDGNIDLGSHNTRYDLIDGSVSASRYEHVIFFGVGIDSEVHGIETLCRIVYVGTFDRTLHCQV